MLQDHSALTLLVIPPGTVDLLQTFMAQIVSKMESGDQYDVFLRYKKSGRVKAHNLAVNVAMSALI